MCSCIHNISGYGFLDLSLSCGEVRLVNMSNYKSLTHHKISISVKAVVDF